MSMNKILVIGNLGSDPEMRYTPSGDAVTSFSVATNRRYKNRDGQTVDETEWFRVSAWRRLAEVTNQYLSKGSRVYVEGRLRSRSWVGQDGQTRFSNEINAQDVQFLSSPGQTSGDPGFTGGGQTAPPQDDDADDLPW
jgi:single-strand DNA-binding protein